MGLKKENQDFNKNLTKKDKNLTNANDKNKNLTQSQKALQQSFNKLENNTSKEKNSIAKNFASKSITVSNHALEKGLNKVNQELEHSQADDGFQVVGKASGTIYKVGKKNNNIIKQTKSFKENRENNFDLKESSKLLKKEVKLGKYAIAEQKAAFKQHKIVDKLDSTEHSQKSLDRMEKQFDRLANKEENAIHKQQKLKKDTKGIDQAKNVLEKQDNKLNNKLNKERDLDNDGIPDRIDIDDTRNSVQTAADLSLVNNATDKQTERHNRKKKTSDTKKTKYKETQADRKENKADLKLVKKEQSKNSFSRQLANKPFTLAGKGINNSASNYKKQLENSNEGVEVAGKSLSLAKEGSKTLARTKKIRKHKKNQEKLKGVTRKLSDNKDIRNAKSLKKPTNSKLQKTNKTQLKKKMVRKKMYAAHNEKNKVVSAFSGGMKNFFKKVSSKVSFAAIKSAIGSKLAIGAGAVLLKLIPVFIIIFLLIGIVTIFSMGGGGGGEYENSQINANIGGSKALPPEVEQWRDLVTTEAEAQGMGDYVNLVLAIIAVETLGTGTRDIMQSSESAGHPPNYFQSEEESVRQGISHLKDIVTILQGFGNGYEENAKLIAQTYNYGVGFASYVGARGGEYDLDMAESYSRDVVAVSLGNYTGQTYPYVNEVSQKLGKTYLYSNGGNYLYGELIGQYLSSANAFDGDFQVIMDELEKYEGWSYVWGGKTPTTGFDCSGLIDWGLQQVGISLPSPASAQYDNTVPIDESEAQPGDLIFFKGTYGAPDHVSHVGFYVDENTMYDANGSGVGYSEWTSSYWQQYYAGIRRVVE